MAAPSVTYTLTNGTTADASQVMQNFNDLINGVSDGTKDLSINALTCAGTATLNGHVNVGNASADDLTITASLASTIPIKTNNSFDIGSATLGLKRIYLGNGGVGATCDIVAASHATTREYTIPDCSAAASFVMTAAAQTIGGAKTFTATPTFSAANFLLAADGSGLGSAAAPYMTPSDDTNTGIYFTGADQIGISCGGTAALSFSSARVPTFTGANFLLAADASGIGSAASPYMTPSDDTNTGIYFLGADQMGFSTGGTSALAFSSAQVPTFTGGNFRVAATAAGNAAAPYMTPSNDTDTGLYFLAANQVGLASAGVSGFAMDSTSKVMLGNNTNYNSTINFYGDAQFRRNVTSGVNTMVTFKDGNTDPGDTCGTITIDATANTTAYNTSSDGRLKTNFQDFDGLSLVNAIEAKAYERTSDPGTIEYGVVAQQLASVYAKAVSPGGADPTNEPWSVDYSKLVGILVRAVQQLAARG